MRVAQHRAVAGPDFEDAQAKFAGYVVGSRSQSWYKASVELCHASGCLVRRFSRKAGGQDAHGWAGFDQGKYYSFAPIL